LEDDNRRKGGEGKSENPGRVPWGGGMWVTLVRNTTEARMILKKRGGKRGHLSKPDQPEGVTLLTRYGKGEAGEGEAARGLGGKGAAVYPEKKSIQDTSKQSGGISTTKTGMFANREGNE